MWWVLLAVAGTHYKLFAMYTCKTKIHFHWRLLINDIKVFKVPFLITDATCKSLQLNRKENISVICKMFFFLFSWKPFCSLGRHAIALFAPAESVHLYFWLFTLQYCSPMLFRTPWQTVESRLKFPPPVISFEGVSQCNRKPSCTLQHRSLTLHPLRPIKDIPRNERSKHSAAQIEILFPLSLLPSCHSSPCFVLLLVFSFSPSSHCSHL